MFEIRWRVHAKIRVRLLLASAVVLMVVALPGVAEAQLLDLLILEAGAAPPDTELMASGYFNTVDSLNTTSSTPTLAQLTPYDRVLAVTNNTPADGAALGNVLADYVDAGGNVVICTYAISPDWLISGRITSPGYSPLLSSGTTADVSGNLNVLVPSDPMFVGVDIGSLVYFHNNNFAVPDLAAGALLLADDGAGTRMIARNASNSVVAMNLFAARYSPNNAEFFELLANAIATADGNAPEPQGAPIPALDEVGIAVLVLLIAALGAAVVRFRLA
jgi:hypothetical protein